MGGGTISVGYRPGYVDFISVTEGVLEPESNRYETGIPLHSKSDSNQDSFLQNR